MVGSSERRSHSNALSIGIAHQQPSAADVQIPHAQIEGGQYCPIATPMARIGRVLRIDSNNKKFGAEIADLIQLRRILDVEYALIAVYTFLAQIEKCPAGLCGGRAM
jgi:hypothetical protein